MRQLFSKIKTEDLIFDLIIIVSAIFIKDIITLGFRQYPPFVPVVLAFLFIISLSYKMGNYFVKYKEYKNKQVNIFLFIVSIFIFPMIIVVGNTLFELHNTVPFSTDNTIFAIIALILVVSSLIFGVKAQKQEKTYKKLNFTITIIASLLFSIFENFIFLIVDINHQQTFKEFMFFVILIIVNGYLPYRLVMAFSPPKNIINMIFGFGAIVVTIVMLGLRFFQI